MLNEFDIKVLRELNGEHQPDLKWGAAMAIVCEDLKRWGYACGLYDISEKGREYLRGIEIQESEVDDWSKGNLSRISE